MTQPSSGRLEALIERTNTTGPDGMNRSLAERFYQWRDRVVSSPRFQRWAAAFPLTRWVANRQSRQLFDLCAGFVYSQILSACIQLDLFRILDGHPQSAVTLAPKLSMSVEAAERLLKAAVALKLLAIRGQDAGPAGPVRYGLGMHGAALLGNPGVTDMIRHHQMLYADLAEPLALLRDETGQRKTALGAFWPYAREGGQTDKQAVSSYSHLMSASQSLVVDDILEAYPFHQHHHAMDVGGGDGTFLMALANHAKSLKVTLFDLPAVAGLAAERFAAAQLNHRAVAFGGNAANGLLPKGADLITLVRVLHDHDDRKALAILSSIYDALPPGGTLLIAEPMSGMKGAEPVGDAYFGFYLLAMGSGRPRKPAEIIDFLRQSGFEETRVLPTRRPLMTSAISAKKPVKS